MAYSVAELVGNYYYFLTPVGRKSKSIATQLVTLILRTLPLPERVLLVIDDSPTKRYGPKVEGADVHHNPTPGPADQPFLYEKLTGREFMQFIGGLYEIDDDLTARKGEELMDAFGVADVADQLIEDYSHGMRQKLIISSALIHKPECIVVDEPMVGLDPRGARLLKDIFRGFVGRGGTILMSTHTLEVAQVMCDRTAIIQEGNIVASGTIEELRQQTAAGDASLEELFLKLTGGTEIKELAAMLKD